MVNQTSSAKVSLVLKNPTANRKRPTPREPEPEPDPPHMIGYARVSTRDQNPQMQIDALIRAGVHPDDIYHETVSGAAKRRPQFSAMMKDVREGDIVVVWKLDRLGRTNIGLHLTAEAIREKGAHLKVLDSSGLDTTTAAGRMMFAMMAAYAQFERDMNHERTMAGLAAARERGRVGGTVAKHSHEQIVKFAKLGTTQGAKAAGMSKPGFIKAYKRARIALNVP